MLNRTVKIIGLGAGLFIGAVLLSAVVGTGVFASGGPHQGTFSATTDACGGCHRTHTAQASLLLVSANQYNMCTSCHGGSGADTDVVHGIYLGSSQGQRNNGLKGGGFGLALMNAGLSTSFVPDDVTQSENVTSRHTVGVSTAAAWGSGNVTGSGELVSLECGDCHNPHGNGNYRMLRPKPTSLDGWESLSPVNINSGQTDSYTVGYYAPGSTTGGVYTPYNLTTPANEYYSDVPMWRNFLMTSAINPNTGNWYTPDVSRLMSDWCGQCHTRYDRSSRSTPLAAPFVYGHRTDFYHNTNGTTSTSTSSVRNCLMCHVAHGTSAAMSGLAAAVEWPGSASPDWQGAEGNSRLLSADNRGVCRQCHATSLSAN